MKKYYCDNCKKGSDKLSGRFFQCGKNSAGETGTWCSEKCFKEHKKCDFEVGFNALGMPLFFCATHGKMNSKYARAKEKCYTLLARKLKKIVSK